MAVLPLRVGGYQTIQHEGLMVPDEGRRPARGPGVVLTAVGITTAWQSPMRAACLCRDRRRVMAPAPRRPVAAQALRGSAQAPRPAR
jgi:hypothetical protein